MISFLLAFYYVLHMYKIYLDQVLLVWEISYRK